MPNNVLQKKRPCRNLFSLKCEANLFDQQPDLSELGSPFPDSPEVRSVLKVKRLVLLEKLAHELQWPDKTIHDELRNGFMLTGYAPPTGIFKPELKPAKLDKTQLMLDSKFLRPLILGKLKHAPAETEDEQTLYDITLKEAQVKGWLHGPFGPDEITTQQNGPWLPVRRFGIWQKGKFRPINDMKENHSNDCFTTCDKVDMLRTMCCGAYALL